MRTFFHSASSFNVHSDPGSVVPAVPRFSSGFIGDAGGGYAEVSDDDVIAAALRILSGRVVRSNPLKNPRAIREYLAVRFAGLEYEVFACVYLNNQRCIIAFEELFRGTIDGTSVHRKRVVWAACSPRVKRAMMAPCSDEYLVVLAARRRRDDDRTIEHRGAGARQGNVA
jgi:hypothetical protein